jgi:cell division protein FtsB
MRGARFLSLPSDRRWPRRLLLATVLALGLGWLPYQLYGYSSLARLGKLRAELAALRQGNQTLRDKNQRLRTEIQLHDEDPLAAVERVAREDLGLVKPGELVFRIVEDGR